MKKILIISLSIFILLTTVANTLFAATITEENLENSFKKLIEESKNNSNSLQLTDESATMTIDKDKKEILFSSESTNCTVNYNLSNNPTFTTKLNFDIKMSEEEWTSESDKSSTLALLLLLVSDCKGVNFSDAYFYILFNNVNFSYSISSDEESKISNAIEYGKSIYGNKNSTISDDLFTLSTQIITNNEKTYEIEQTIEINNEADFSKMNRLAEKYQNSINDLNNQLATENKIFQQYEEVIKNIAKVTNNITKLPQTGNFFNIKDILYLTILCASTLLIAIIIKSIRYTNINKK